MEKGLIEDIAETLRRAWPSAPEDVKRNLRAMVKSTLERYDLVSREELEVQEAVLARTRERLKALEARVLELEEKLRPKK